MIRPHLRMGVAVGVVFGTFLLVRAHPETFPYLGGLSFLLWLGSAALGRSFFAGRRLQHRGQPRAAIAEYERFLHPSQAGLRRALSFLWMGIYTSDPVALAYNNIGACRLDLGELEEAAAALKAALALDARYAIPHVNLAVVNTLRGEDEAAAQNGKEAVRLGYTKSLLDRLVQGAVAKRSAAVEAPGSGRPPSP